MGIRIHYLASVVGTMQALMTVASSSPLGISNSSTTPAHLPWNTYNYCNAPHVNAAHYDVPPEFPGAQLVYLNLLMRHHKVRLLDPALVQAFVMMICERPAYSG